VSLLCLPNVISSVSLTLYPPFLWRIIQGQKSAKRKSKPESTPSSPQTSKKSRVPKPYRVSANLFCQNPESQEFLTFLFCLRRGNGPLQEIRVKFRARTLQPLNFLRGNFPPCLILPSTPKLYFPPHPKRMKQMNITP
jgi:hypothetical protein